VHAERGAWAGSTLAAWHRETAGRDSLDEALGGIEPFEQQRLRPFHETVMTRRPELAAAIAPYRDALRAERLCLVHGDYAMKNMLLRRAATWVVDFEVAHLGNPVFDLAFFHSFVLLSAIRWPDRAGELQALGEGFLAAYRGGSPFPLDDDAITGHTACLVLARTDGKSPAQFLDDPSRERAREVGIEMLDAPGRGLFAGL
jgi:aminoglycoside phosphotransferase (APT) family kinase protein